MNQAGICVAQTCPVAGDISANLAQHLLLVELAAGFGVGVVVFPELSLTGYELGLAERLAFSEADPRLAPLAEAAASCSLSLIVGAPVRTGQGLHIGAFILRPDGSSALYTKRHLGAFGESASCDGTLPPPEPSIFVPGNHDPLIPLANGVAAVAICADTGRPSHVARAAERGASVYLASMFVIPSDFDGDSARLGRYAVDHSMIVAMSNFGSPTGGLAAAGRSSIWSPDGVLRCRMPSQGAGVAVAIPTPDGWRAETALL